MTLPLRHRDLPYPDLTQMTAMSRFNDISMGKTTNSNRQRLSDLAGRNVTLNEMMEVTQTTNDQAANIIFEYSRAKAFELAAEIVRTDRDGCRRSDYSTTEDYLTDIINRSANEALLQNRAATLKSASKLGLSKNIVLDEVKLYPVQPYRWP